MPWCPVLIRRLCAAMLASSLLCASGAGCSRDDGDPGTDLRVGARLPDGEVLALDGRVVRLAQRVGRGVAVIVLGNFTCPGFRGHVPALEALAAHYRGGASFVMLYLRESHPTDGGGPDAVLRGTVGVCMLQPTTDAERIANARNFVAVERWTIPTLAVPMDDVVLRELMPPGSPMRLIIVEDGVVRYRSRFGYIDVDAADAWLADRFPSLPHPAAYVRALHPAAAGTGPIAGPLPDGPRRTATVPAPPPR